jgi:hypothetical protein
MKVPHLLVALQSHSHFRILIHPRTHKPRSQRRDLGHPPGVDERFEQSLFRIHRKHPWLTAFMLLGIIFVE